MNRYYKMSAAFFLIFALGGCGLTPYGDAFVKKGAEVADQGLQNARDFACNVATIGSVRRKYGKTKDAAIKYNEYCEIDADIGAADLVKPNE